MPPLVELVADRGQRRSHTLLGRQSHDLELPLLVGPTKMSESQEVERFRPALPPLAPPLGRIPAKLDQARFIGMQRQPEFRQSFLQICQERPRCSLLLEAHHTIVGITQHNDLSSPWLFPPALNPQIEGVV